MRDAETALERLLPLARDMGEAFDLDAYRALFQRIGLDRVVEVAEPASVNGPAGERARSMR